MLRRAVVFTASGPPAKSIRVVTFPRLPAPSPSTVNIRFALSPVNPSDINVIEGVYPSKPAPCSSYASEGPGSSSEPCYIVGNEGLAEVANVGQGVKYLQPGDRVVMVKPQAGTWASCANVSERDIIKIPNGSQISDVQGATMSVNPPTAYNMLKQFVKLNPGDWVIQNGANSGVGQAVIQIAAHFGFKTMNFIRERPDINSLKDHLTQLGATEVFALEDLLDKKKLSGIRSIFSGNGSSPRLALNCVSGPSTAPLVNLMGKHGHLVTYGAMSKQPLSLPNGAFIFKNLTAHGFMQGQWYKENSIEAREALMADLTSLMIAGKLREPPHEIFRISSTMSDIDATSALRKEIERTTSGTGKAGKKLLLRFDD